MLMMLVKGAGIISFPSPVSPFAKVLSGFCWARHGGVDEGPTRGNPLGPKSVLIYRHSPLQYRSDHSYFYYLFGHILEASPTFAEDWDQFLRHHQHNWAFMSHFWEPHICSVKKILESPNRPHDELLGP